METHVLLAACRHDALAYEFDGHGVFTDALLRLLRKENISNLNYADVIMGMPDLRFS